MSLAAKMYCKCGACERARAGGDWGNVEYGDVYGPWEEAPRWHPARLMGWTVRRRVIDTMGRLVQPPESWFEYGNPKKVAREQLEKIYGR